MKKVCPKHGEHENWRFRFTDSAWICRPCEGSRRPRNKIRTCSMCGGTDPGIFYEKSKVPYCRKCFAEYRKKSKDDSSAKKAAYRKAHPKQSRSLNQRALRRLKDGVYEAYGGYRCSRCGCTDSDVLTIDHIDPSTKTSRKDGGATLYRRLRREGFPPGYQVLCFNCNIKKHREYERSKQIEG